MARRLSSVTDRIPVSASDEVLKLRTSDGMPFPDEDFPLNNHDLGVPWQAVVTRMDLIRVAVVVERLEVDGADGPPVGDVLLGIGAFCHVGQYHSIYCSDGRRDRDRVLGFAKKRCAPGAVGASC